MLDKDLPRLEFCLGELKRNKEDLEKREILIGFTKEVGGIMDLKDQIRIKAY